jgi:hypothetical protein
MDVTPFAFCLCPLRSFVCSNGKEEVQQQRQARQPMSAVASKSFETSAVQVQQQ